MPLDGSVETHSRTAWRGFLCWCQSTKITLESPLTLSHSARFPLQSEIARREVCWGACLLILLPGLGWLLNMGHRIQMVHHMQQGKSPWPAWVNYPRLLWHGVITFAGMLFYYAPGVTFLCYGYQALGGILVVLATLAIPGYMTHYCKAFEVREIFNPWRALSRALQGGWAYWKAWGIALLALASSFLGLLFGLGFLVTSVWFWQVAGFSFASVFSQHHRLVTKGFENQGLG